MAGEGHGGAAKGNLRAACGVRIAAGLLSSVANMRLLRSAADALSWSGRSRKPETRKSAIDAPSHICDSQNCDTTNPVAKRSNQTTTMQAPYIPAPKALFALWIANFAALIAATPTDYGLIAGDAATISAAADAYAAAYTASETPETRTSATIAEENAQRASATATVRPYAVQISRNPAVSNELKVGVGVNLPNATRTPIPAPTTQPVLIHNGSSHLTAALAFRDTETPFSKAKPFGATALEVRRTIGTAPAVDPDTALLAAMITKSPFSLAFISGDVGKVATLWGRWTTRSGPAGVAQAGPWSAALSFGII